MFVAFPLHKVWDPGVANTSGMGLKAMIEGVKRVEQPVEFVSITEMVAEGPTPRFTEIVDPTEEPEIVPAPAADHE